MQYCLVILCTILIWCQTAFAQELTFGTHTKPPSSDLTEKLYTEVFKRMGYTFHQKLLPGVRVLIDVNSGKIDGDANRIKKIKAISKENLENYRIVDEPIIAVELVLITKDSRQIATPSWDEANTGHTAYIRGSKRIRKNIFAENRHPVNAPAQALKLVRSGRAQGAVFFKLMAKDLLKKDTTGKFKTLKVHETPIETFNLYPFVHKKHQALIPQMAQTLRDMKKDGTYAKIVSAFQ